MKLRKYFEGGAETDRGKGNGQRRSETWQGVDCRGTFPASRRLWWGC